MEWIAVKADGTMWFIPHEGEYADEEYAKRALLTAGETDVNAFDFIALPKTSVPVKIVS